MRCIVPKIQPDPLSKICAKENCSQIVVTMCVSDSSSVTQRSVANDKISQVRIGRVGMRTLNIK